MQACCLCAREFLTALTGSSREQQQTRLFNGQVADSEVNVFLEGSLSFNHFIKLHYHVVYDQLELFYRRGAAIICMENEVAFDLVIPVRLKRVDGTYTMSGIFVQCRNYKTREKDLSILANECSLSRSKFTESPTDPYLTLYMQLGDNVFDGQTPEYIGPLPKSWHMRTRNPNSRSGSEQKYQLVLGMFGCSQVVYPFLSAASLEQVRTLRDAVVDERQFYQNNRMHRLFESQPLSFASDYYQ